MTQFIIGNCENNTGRYIAAWWQQASGHSIYAPYSCLGLHNGSELIGAVIFVNYTGSSIELHVHLADKRCLSKGLIKHVAHYVYGELSCCVLRALPYHSNAKVNGLLIRLGFVREAVLERFYSEQIHAVCYKLTKEQAIELGYWA